VADERLGGVSCDVTYLVDLNNQISLAIASLRGIEKSIDNHDRDINLIKDQINKVIGEFSRLSGKISQAESNQPDLNQIRMDVSLLKREAENTAKRMDSMRNMIWGGLGPALVVLAINGIAYLASNQKTQRSSATQHPLHILYDRPNHTIDLCGEQVLMSHKNRSGRPGHS
jgi:hypothetical protein